jgi:homogentisate 1,2-dioxygenase
MAAHGPDADTFAAASQAELAPQKISDTMAFMFETKLAVRPTKFALACPQLQADYYQCWAGLEDKFRS